jgi:hypothetical protein
MFNTDSQPTAHPVLTAEEIGAYRAEEGVYVVPLQNLPTLEAKLDKLARKAERLAGASISYEVLGQHDYVRTVSPSGMVEEWDGVEDRAMALPGIVGHVEVLHRRGRASDGRGAAPGGLGIHRHHSARRRRGQHRARSAGRRASQQIPPG